jgi:hypothetical protein
MRLVRALATVAILGGALFGFWRFFVSETEGAAATAGRPPAVIFSAPPGYDTVEGGSLTRRSAASRLAALLAERPGIARLALHFEDDGTEVYWLADRRDPAAPVLVERAAGATGTRLETTWTGDLGSRLDWAAVHGSLDAPDLPPGTTRNLYH